MKNVLAALMLLLSVGCNKTVEHAVEDEEFCLCDSLTIPVINQYLAGMNDDLDPPPEYHEFAYSEYEKRKLKFLCSWLSSSCDKIKYLRIGCYACMNKGNAPGSSRIVVMADENGKTKDYLLEISMNDHPLEIVSWYARPVYDCKDEYYYYKFYYSFLPNHPLEKVEKIILDNREFRNDCLIVGFFDHLQDAEMVDYINQTGLFKPAYADDIILRPGTVPGFTRDYHSMYIEFKSPQSCSKLKEIIRTLEKSPIVAFVNLVFEGGNESPWEFEKQSLYTHIFAFSEAFSVVVENENDLSDLSALIQETNTWISGRYGNTLSIGTNKNSKGNAMEMANYFWETGKFVTYPMMLMMIAQVTYY